MWSHGSHRQRDIIHREERISGVKNTERMRRMRIEKESWKSCNIRLLNVVGGGWG